MFQNISGQVDTDDKKEENYIKDKLEYIIRKLFTKQNIILYILTFMISKVTLGQTMAPFALAIFAACCSNKIPAGIVYIMTLLRNRNRFWK